MPESDDFKEVLFAVAVKTDALRAAGLRGLGGVTRARQAGLERERGRLSRKLGADHSRVRALSARMEDGVARLRDLTVEVARAETVAPRADPGKWVLHGYVRRKDLSPAPDLTVALVDAQGQWLRALGFACTDARGYFQLVATVAGGRAAGASAPPSKIEAHIRITDRKRVQLYRGEEAVPVSLGGVEYREIVLDGGAAGCVAPEEEVPGPSPRPQPKEASPARGRRSRRPS
jgi:hypothetical protein